MRPPFVPDWISDQMLVANTIAFEMLVVVAILWFVVRRAENKRRAGAILFAVVAVIAAVEVVGGVDVLCTPRFQRRLYDHVNKDGSGVTFSLDWNESRLLGRATNRRIVVWFVDPQTRYAAVATVAPNDFTDIWPIVVRDHGEDRTSKDAIGLALWKALRASPSRNADPRLAAILSRDGD